MLPDCGQEDLFQAAPPRPQVANLLLQPSRGLPQDGWSSGRRKLDDEIIISGFDLAIRRSQLARELVLSGFQAYIVAADLYLLEILNSSVRNEPPAAEYHHMVADRLHVRQKVAREEHAHAL